MMVESETHKGCARHYTEWCGLAESTAKVADQLGAVSPAQHRALLKSLGCESGESNVVAELAMDQIRCRCNVFIESVKLLSSLGRFLLRSNRKENARMNFMEEGGFVAGQIENYRDNTEKTLEIFFKGLSEEDRMKIEDPKNRPCEGEYLLRIPSVLEEVEKLL